MARQPLNSRLPDTGISFGPGFLSQRPKAAALIAECIATWSEIELQTGRLLAGMLGVPFEPVTAFYLNLASQREKRKALDPIAKFIFREPAQLELYETIMRARSSSENERVELAHSLFGIASDDPDGVIMIGTSDRIKNMFEIDELINEHFAALYEGTTTDFGSNLHIKHRKIRDYVYHYKLEDLTKSLHDMNHLHQVIMIFTGYASYVIKKNYDEERQSYQTLMSLPLVRRFLPQPLPNRGNGS